MVSKRFNHVSPMVQKSVSPQVLVSISRFETRIRDFRCSSLGHQLQFAIIILLVAKCRLLSVDLQQVFQFFRLFDMHLVQTLLYAVSRSVKCLLIILHPTWFRRPERCRSWIGPSINLWDPRWIHCRLYFFEEVVDHPSNLTASKWSSLVELCLLLRWLVSWSFLSGCVLESASNLEFKILEVWSWSSCQSCWGNEVVNTFSTLNFTNPKHSGSSMLRRIRDCASEAHFPTSEFCWLRPLVNNNRLSLSFSLSLSSF